MNFAYIKEAFGNPNCTFCNTRPRVTDECTKLDQLTCENSISRKKNSR